MKKMIKASLAWNLKDYLAANEEPPAYVLQGKTEGQIMEDEEVEAWCDETVRMLSVFGQEYPEKFEEQCLIFQADLDYLCSLGKISKEESLKLRNRKLLEFE